MMKPTILSWNTTYRCNLKCKHCYASASDVTNSNELSTDEGLKLIDDLGQYKGLVLVFSGGEPLVRKDITTLISAASENGMRPVIGTNGWFLPQLASQLKEAGLMKAGVSLDSHRAGVHDAFRGVPGAFQKSIDGIKASHEVGLATQIHTTISEDNIHELGNMVQLTEDLGCDALHVFFMVPTGRASNLDLLSVKKYEDVLELLYELQKQASIQIKPVCAPQYLRVFSEKSELDSPEAMNQLRNHGHFTRFRRGCLAGLSYARVDPFGNVTPCPYLDYVVGSVREDTFHQILENSPILNQFRTGELVKGKCTVCEFLDVCGGGCRARAHAVTGKLDGSTVWCSHEPNGRGGAR